MKSKNKKYFIYTYICIYTHTYVYRVSDIDCLIFRVQIKQVKARLTLN